MTAAKTRDEEDARGDVREAPRGVKRLPLLRTCILSTSSITGRTEHYLPGYLGVCLQRVLVCGVFVGAGGRLRACTWVCV